jgi:predicted transcriptional regulator
VVFCGCKLVVFSCCVFVVRFDDGLEGFGMSRYRDRLQIIASILSIVSSGARKTRIMYQANLSYKLLCRYLDEVLDSGLVCFEKGECYVLTAKGQEFLDRHEEYSKRRKNLEQHLNHVNGEKVALEKMCISAGRVNSNLNRLGKNGELRK